LPSEQDEYHITNLEIGGKISVENISQPNFSSDLITSHAGNKRIYSRCGSLESIFRKLIFFAKL